MNTKHWAATPKTLIQTIEQYDNAMMEASHEGHIMDVNASSILTKLIQDAGRFAESYASDLFILWESFMDTLKKLDKEICLTETAFVTSFGIRRFGVDGNYYLMQRLAETVNGPGSYVGSYVHAEHVYRKIFFLETTISPGGSGSKRIELKLYDATSDIYKLCEDDAGEWYR